jgi:hypothetical protein
MTDIVSALVQAWAQFKIRTHCLSAAKAKRSATNVFCAKAANVFFREQSVSYN